MRIQTSGELPALDLDAAFDLVGPLWEAWQGLRFDAAGLVVHPRTGTGESRVRLHAGRHGSAGAEYVITVEQAVQEAGVQVGVEQVVTLLRVVAHDRRQTEVAVRDEPGTWELRAVLDHDREPGLELSGTIDITASLGAGSGPVTSWFLGGTGSGTLTVDTAALGAGGTALRGEGRANRFHGHGHLDVAGRGSRRRVEGELVVRGKGLGRLLLALGGGLLRRRADASIAGWWAGVDTRAATVDGRLAELRARTAAEGPDAVVQRLLWEPGYAAGLTRG